MGGQGSVVLLWRPAESAKHLSGNKDNSRREGESRAVLTGRDSSWPLVIRLCCQTGGQNTTVTRFYFDFVARKKQFVLKITVNRSIQKNVSFVLFLLCRSLAIIFLYHLLSIKVEEWVYMVCVLYMRMRIHGRKRLERRVEDGSEYWA